MDKLGVFHTNQTSNVSRSTSELRVRFARREIFLLTVPRQYFFCDHFMIFMSCVCHAFASVHCCLVVT